MKETIRKYNVAMPGDYSAGVLTAMGMPTGILRFTTMLQTALKKVLSIFYNICRKLFRSLWGSIVMLKRCLVLL